MQEGNIYSIDYYYEKKPNQKYEFFKMEDTNCKSLIECLELIIRHNFVEGFIFVVKRNKTPIYLNFINKQQVYKDTENRINELRTLIY